MPDLQFLETERHKLGPNLTPVTPESFAKWKQTRLDAKSASEDAERKAKAATANANKAAGLSGRDMYVATASRSSLTSQVHLQYVSPPPCTLRYAASAEPR